MEIERWAKIRIAARSSIATAGVILVGIIIWMNLAPLGAKVTYDINLTKQSEHVTLPAPIKSIARVGADESGDTYQVQRMAMTTDKATFSLDTPFDRLKRIAFEVEYGGDPTELGLSLINPDGSGLTYKPLHNESLNRLGWPTVSDGSTTLFQRNAVYANPGEFLQALYGSRDRNFDHAGNQVAFFGYPLEPVYVGIDETQANAGTVIEHAFRGNHTLFVYVNGAPLDLQFNYRELNRLEGVDRLNILLSQAGEVLYTMTEPDDSNTSADSVASDRSVIVHVPNLATGVYKLDLYCGNDAIFYDIISAQKYIGFYEDVFLADSDIYGMPGKGALLFTNGSVLDVQTWHTPSLQTLTINGDQRLSVDRINTTFSAEMSGNFNQVQTQTGSLMLTTPGAFLSFAEDSLFFLVPEFPYTSSLPMSNVGYVITGYGLPLKSGDGWKQEVIFDLTGMPIESRRLDFILSAPGASSAAPVTIGKITATAEK